jgi:hypothetical protein
VTGPEHYREAQRLLATAKTEDGRVLSGYAETLLAAQAHATLAHTAATAMQAPVDGSEPGMSSTEFRAWYIAAGVKPTTTKGN